MSPQDIVNDASFALAATPEMCYYCFDMLIHHYNKNTRSNSPPHPQFQLPVEVSSPLFVTWEKLKDNRYILRGCIGTLSSQSLNAAIGDYALTAALRDRRFDPIKASELSQLRVGVSLLVNYQTCDHVHDWQVGVHGIIIKFKDGSNTAEYSATFLPEVAKEQGWNQEETVEHLIRKSGYDGPVERRLLQLIRCTRYESSKHRVSYQEYVAAVGISDDGLLEATSPGKNRWCFSL